MNHVTVLKSLVGLYFSLVFSLETQAQQWSPVPGKIMTQWAAQVNPANVLPEYPRPQLVRKEWKNLNGLWDYAIRPWDAAKPTQFDGKILVPYAVESALSGVGKNVGDENILWYRTTFTVPGAWKNKRTLLHFGAIDWEAKVYLNGQLIGTHTGGYDPFSFDISGNLTSNSNQELIISVWDPSSDGTQPRGKQVKNPGGIFYTPVTGIWQTVWLEPVAESYLANLKVTPDTDNQQVKITPAGMGFKTGDKIKVVALDGGKAISEVTGNSGQELVLKIPNAKLWAPGNPFLYDLKVSVIRNGKALDVVDSYFGMRKIAVAKHTDGHMRMLLNNQFVFQYGPLDQGWWPDGLYTAPTEEALKYDIDMTKKMGFNMIRKHVKVEPARWYYLCDKAGLLVWQDMPSGDKSAPWTGPSGYDGYEMKRDAHSAMQYRKEWKAIIDNFHHFPSIITWVPFNEGWGQFQTENIINWTMKYDPSRVVDGPSGGNNFPVGHIVDMHNYPNPVMPAPNPRRAIVLGEFGGLGLPLPGHLWKDDKNWGYRTLTTREELETSYTNLINQIPDLIKKGLSAAIYTQTTDVETEVNGLMTYDRKVVKIAPEKLNQVHQVLYQGNK